MKKREHITNKVKAQMIRISKRMKFGIPVLMNANESLIIDDENSDTRW